MNISIGTETNFINSAIYQPTKESFDWCVSQKVIGYNNLELKVVMIVFISLAFMMAYSWAYGTKYEKYCPIFMYLSRMSLYAFFFIYFVVVRGGI